MKIWAGIAVLLSVAVAAVSIQSPSQATARDYDCADFANQAEAEGYLTPGDPNRLDADSDGIACEDLPCPCSSTPGGAAEVEQTPAEPPPKPVFHLRMRAAERISKHLVAVVVNRSGRLDSYELLGCRRLGEPSIDCRLDAHGETPHLRIACQYRVEVRGRDSRPVGQIASHGCRTARVRT
jgi:hypothetical protein